MKQILSIVCLISILSCSLLALDADSLRIKVYQFSASTSEYCTNPETVFSFDDEDAEYKDMLNNPNFGSGTLDDGTYECVIIEMSDQVKFTPSGNDGNCVLDQEETLDVCGEYDDGMVELTDGSSVDCEDDADDRVAIYLSTATPVTADASAFLPPSTSSPNSGLHLAAALVVDGSSSGTLSLDTTGTVSNNTDDNVCDMEAPTFTFSSE